MTNEEFQRAVLDELKGIKGELGEIKTRVSNIEVRQDEIYQVARVIEHSNQIGRSELDNQNIRLAKLEGKYRKVAKAYSEDVEIDRASSL